MLRPAHGRGRVGRQHLAGNEPAEQHAHGGELLRDARRRVLRLQGLYIGRNIEWADRGG
jgi:hypothetical protein